MPSHDTRKLTFPASGGSVVAHGHSGAGRAGVSFETPPMEQETEITGPIVLALWVSSTSEDMDIYATLRNIGQDGKEVFEVGSQGQPVPLTKGWLRASHCQVG